MTDQEINEAVARKLGTWMEGALYPEVPDYCRDIKAAWEVVVHIPQITLKRYPADSDPLDMEWSCWLYGYKNEAIATAATAPMAIALAFLKLHGD